MQGKSTVNPLWINEHFNEAKAKMLPLKSGEKYLRLLNINKGENLWRL